MYLEIEKEGILRAKKVADESHIRVVLVDCYQAITEGAFSPDLPTLVQGENTIVLLNKADLVKKADVERLCSDLQKLLQQECSTPPLEVLPISCRDNKVSNFISCIGNIVSHR